MPKAMAGLVGRIFVGICPDEPTGDFQILTKTIFAILMLTATTARTGFQPRCGVLDARYVPISGTW